MLYVGRARVRSEKFHQLGPERGERRLAGRAFAGVGAQCICQILELGVLFAGVEKKLPDPPHGLLELGAGVIGCA